MVRQSLSTKKLKANWLSVKINFTVSHLAEIECQFLSRNDLPFLLNPYCDYDPFRNPYNSPYPAECLNCRSVPISSYRKPDWF